MDEPVVSCAAGYGVAECDGRMADRRLCPSAKRGGAALKAAVVPACGGGQEDSDRRGR